MTTGPVSQRQESDHWHRTYSAEAERERRLRMMPAKLARLGVSDADRNAVILDTCCGTGETLGVLDGMGFSRLVGVDITVPATLLADARFDVREGDVRSMPFPDQSFDWILNIHALHHLGGAAGIERFLGECHRLLKPGGRLGLVDFPASPQIRLAFWFFRQKKLLLNSYMRNFARLIEEEWPFLEPHLGEWPRTSSLIWRNPGFRVVSKRSGVFYFYTCLEKA